MSTITVDSAVPQHPWGLNWAGLRLKASIVRTLLKFQGAVPPIPTLPEGMMLEKIEVPSRQAGRSIYARIYTPKSPVKNAQGKTPVHVTFQ